MSTASNRYHQRCQTAVLAAFRKVLLGWLMKLPETGWSGPIDALGDELWKLGKKGPVPTYIPFGSGLSKRLMGEAGFLAEHGWRVEFRRTKAARTVHVVRVAA